MGVSYYLGQLDILIIQHIWLVVYSGLLAVGVAVPLGVAITRPRIEPYAQWIINVANIGQTVPSMAVVGLAMPILGIGFAPAVFALFLYALLPIIRNTYAGIKDVDQSIIEAGRGMGMTNTQILVRIELPMALYVIMAGIRTAVVQNVGTAALAFLIGGGGLGDIIFTGISMVNVQLMLAGAIPTALLAVVADTLLGWLERALVPAGLRMERTAGATGA